jgi:vacuolar-type H+-ATPase subunit E/Vma4
MSTTGASLAPASEPLLAELRAAAEAEAGGLLAKAQADAAALVAAARERAARRRDARLAERRATLALEAGMRLDAARADAAREGLRAREGFIERVLEAAIQRARHSGLGPHGDRWLERTLAELVAFLPPGAATVEATSREAGTIARRADPNRSWTVRPLPDSSGAAVEAGDGSLRIDATLDRFVRAERARLAQALVARLGTST